MNRRLHGKHQWRNRHRRLQNSAIPWDAVLIDGKNKVKQGCAGNEAFEMNPVFFVPKHAWDTKFTRIGYHPAKRVVIPLRAILKRSDLIFPGIAQSLPG